MLLAVFKASYYIFEAISIKMEDTSQLYFAYSFLDITSLYGSFREFYRIKKGHLSRHEVSYCKFFFFREMSPQTDLCDFCEKSQLRLAANPTDVQKLI